MAARLHVISLQRYRDLFLLPQVRAVLTASIVARMPIGIAGLAILLFVQTRSGSFAVAGAVSGFYVLGLAVIAPLLGRMIDRLGPPPILIVCALTYPAALAALTFLVLSDVHPAWLAAAALVAGASLPPVSACVRALYPRLVTDTGLIQTAYSVDSAVVEIVFTLGPVLVAACVAVGHAEAAVALAAVFAAVGTSVFVRVPAVRSWKASQFVRKRSWLGALRQPKLIAVYAATFLFAIAFGFYEVGVTAHAALAGSPAAAGIALALTSVGSGAGAVVYGATHWRMPLARQFTLALAAMGCGILLLVPVEGLVLYAAVATLAGIPMSTVIATQSQLVSRLASRDRLAESFTWATTCLLAGVSVGTAAAGLMAEVLAPYWLLVAAAAATTVGALWSALALRGAA
jgi:MFS family permease